MNKIRLLKISIFLAGILLNLLCYSQSANVKGPVTPNASPEAIELLEYLYNISGHKTLTGQHDQPIFGSAYYQLVFERTGKYPAVKGMDFGFSERNTLDGINFRQQIVDEAIAYHKEGAIITLMWHAVPPTHEEPVVFRKHIQGELSEKEWEELITPDTKLNQRWQTQVDVIAFFLKQLRDAGVPVLWRPYHEMNGDWFWWGKKTGEDGYKKLYRMLFRRLVNYHKINNLIWVFNGNEIKGDYIDPYEYYYPGHEFVDVLATDMYSGKFSISDYNDLKKLGGGRPIALGEVGKMPAPEMLLQQPDWVWFMTWVDFVFKANSTQEIEAVYNAENTLTREEKNRIYKEQ
jgi:mannan endo-1,4-beta-mannosidase